MICPECGAEYGTDVTECDKCAVALVEPDATRPDMRFETVLETRDPALVGVAKSLLEARGIEYFGVGENSASVLPGGLKVRLRVDSDRAAEARELLKELGA